MKAFDLIVRTFRVAVPLAALAATAACSVSMDGGKSPDKPIVPEFAHKASGPSLDGEWLSGCVRDPWGRYEQNRMTFKGQDVSRVSDKYADAYCSSKTDTLSGTGKFRYAKDDGGGVYEIDYQITQASKGFPGGDNVRRIGDRMWMSDGYITGTPTIEYALQRSK